MPPLSHFARLAAVPIDYLVRLESAVRHSQVWSTGTEYKAIRNRIIDLCGASKEKIFKEAMIFRRIYGADLKSSSSEELTEAEELAVRAVLRSTAGTFTTLHELLLFLPRESIRRELKEYCECLFRSEFDSSKISLILTSLFNAFEYSLDDVMRFLEADVFKFKIPNPDANSAFGTVMELAIVDRNNPLAWSVLAHEFGHHLDEGHNLTQTAVREFGEKMNTSLPPEVQRALERLCTEIVADLTGYYLQGPCSIVPLVNMSLLIGCMQDKPIKFDGEHGAPSTRVEMIRAVCRDSGMSTEKLDPLLDTLVLEETRKEAELTQDERDHRTLMHKFLNEFFDVVRPVIIDALSKLPLVRFEAKHFQRSTQLSSHLANGLPIGAARVHSEEDARQHLLSHSGGAPESIRENYFFLEERAVAVAEVITAGCLDRVRTMSELYKTAFEADSAEAAFSVIAAGHEDQDRLLFKSIDMIPMLEAHDAASG